MGAWGAKPFDNDQALDWLGSGPTLKRVRAALRDVVDVPKGEEPEADEGAAAIGAIACIVAARGHVIDGLPDGAKKGLAALRRTLTPADLKQAKQALARVTSKSELATLWGGAKKWRAVCDELAKLLAAKPAPLPKFVRPRTLRPKIGDVVLVPLKNGTRAIVKIISIIEAAPKPIQFGLYPIRLGADEAPPKELPPAFIRLLHGLTRLGPTFWPVLRNEPVKASELLPLTQGEDAKDKSTMSGGLRLRTNADGTATVSFTKDVTRRLELAFSFSGAIANQIERVLQGAPDE